MDHLSPAELYALRLCYSRSCKGTPRRSVGLARCNSPKSALFPFGELDLEIFAPWQLRSVCFTPSCHALGAGHRSVEDRSAWHFVTQISRFVVVRSAKLLAFMVLNLMPPVFEAIEKNLKTPPPLV